MLGIIAVSLFVIVSTFMMDFLSQRLTHSRPPTRERHALSIGSTFIGISIIVMFLASCLTNEQYWGLITLPMILILGSSIVAKVDSYIRFNNRLQ